MTMAVPKRRQVADGPYPMTSNTRQLVVFLGIGLIAGFLASLIVGGDGLIRYLITGVLGALVGGYLFTALRVELPIKNQFLSQVVTATAGAIVVVVIARLIA
jgi:uncharacterized membrane protein YeaQ/YmgE (transglycosylase-associated protein family)